MNVIVLLTLDLHKFNRAPYSSPTKYSHRQPTQKLLRLLWSLYSIKYLSELFFLQWLYSVLCTMFSFLYKAVCNKTWTLHWTFLICDYWYQLLLLVVLIFPVAFMVMVNLLIECFPLILVLEALDCAKQRASVEFQDCCKYSCLCYLWFTWMLTLILLSWK